MTKYIMVTGGVVSSLGKGITSASIGMLLKRMGYKVSILKCDPYINVDPGTLSPFQHGEVFVTADGAETDLDLGHYERFLDVTLSKLNNTTTGQIYNNVITKERKGSYLGSTVQVVPHITNEIKSKIRAAGQGLDILITEIGGTTGDIESLPFLEAIRQMRIEEDDGNVIYIHLTYIPYIKAAEELKTKPTQHSVSGLRGIGIQPDILVCRTEYRLSKDIKKKIGLFCNVKYDNVVQAIDSKSIYEAPLKLRDEKIEQKILGLLNLSYKKYRLRKWKDIVDTIYNPKYNVRIGLTGKYNQLKDSYKSILEAFIHAGANNQTNVEVVWINAEDIEPKKSKKMLSDLDGILVPGGFGERGIEGKIEAAKFARIHKIPYFGICLGMHVAVIEFARNVVGLKNANSSEFKKEDYSPVISLMEKQKQIEGLGGTMRLGEYRCVLKKGTKIQKVYNKQNITERHRHRYEFNNDYNRVFIEKGLIISGQMYKSKLVETIELKEHPWYIGVQFHPEFLSRPMKPHPLFDDFIRTCRDKKYQNYNYFSIKG